ncbi:CPBP family intramembrane metalloprotease [Clostridium algoriphilum]|uniref:CPBP family intramembrane glutamic endopeptidase n=1 Tax=Clostridium algoriphilum TaxID=198347 RepID=UPI001CF12F93|nr:CPBP family intramembrane glutamic endopeptidase [Clostridium algoriphilum]MCB2292842.1 CPBP family intramembrane metalloprotease [Clostridium algoriphilum]
MKSKKILLANILLLVALLLFIFVPSLANIFLKLKGSISGDISLLLSGGTTVITLGGIALLYCKIIKIPFNKVMVIKKISVKQVYLIMLVAVGTYIFAVGINSVSMKLFPVAIKDSMQISNLLNSSSLLLGLIVVVLLPAFFEEVFFRGIFLDAYEGVNKKVKYIIITLIFATFHGNVMQIIYVMFLGLILLKVREHTGSIVGSMTLHAANNAISFIISKIAMNYTKVINTGTNNGVIDPSQAAAAADVMNASFLVVFLRALIFLLIGGAMLYINLRKLKECIEEKVEIEPVKKDYLVRNEGNGNIKTIQYIPLTIYFASMIVIVVLRY